MLTQTQNSPSVPRYFDCWHSPNSRASYSTDINNVIGTLIGTRNSSGATALYWAGSAVGSGSDPSYTTKNSNALFLLGRNRNGSLHAPSGRQLSLFAVGNSGLTSTEAIALTTAIGNLQTALSR